jgi:hypothetical protein
MHPGSLRPSSVLTGEDVPAGTAKGESAVPAEQGTLLACHVCVTKQAITATSLVRG